MKHSNIETWPALGLVSFGQSRVTCLGLKENHGELCLGNMYSNSLESQKSSPRVLHVRPLPLVEVVVMFHPCNEYLFICALYLFINLSIYRWLANITWAFHSHFPHKFWSSHELTWISYVYQSVYSHAHWKVIFPPPSFMRAHVYIHY